MGQTTVIQLPFAGGLDQKTAKYYLDPASKLATITDGNFVKTGTVDKRQGISHLPNTQQSIPGVPFLTAGNQLTSWSRGSLLAMQPGFLFAQESSQSGCVGVGPLPPPRAIRRPAPISPPAFATSFGGTAANAPNIVDFPVGTATLRLSAYQGPVSSGGLSTIYATVTDAVTGDVVCAPQLLYTSGGVPGAGAVIAQVLYLPGAPSANQQVLVVWMDQHNASVTACFYQPTSNTFSVNVSILPANSLGCMAFDIVPYQGDAAHHGMLAIYPSDHASNQSVGYLYLSPNLAVLNSGTIDNAPGGSVVAPDLYVYGTSGEALWYFYSFYNSGTSTWIAKWKILNGSFVTQAGPFTLATVVTSPPCQLIPPARVNGTTVFAGVLSGIGGVGLLGQPLTFGGIWSELGVASGATPVDSGAWPVGFYPSTRAFVVNGSLYQPAELALYAPHASGATATGSQQNTLFLLQLQTNTALVSRLLPVATVAPRQIQTSAQPLIVPGAARENIPLPSALTGTRYGLSVRTIGVDTFANEGNIGAVAYVDFYFDATSQSLLYQSNELGQELRIAGASPFVCDGAQTFEDSFFYYPEFSTLSQSGSGSALTGTYTYAIVYVYTDAAGLLHRSVPFVTAPITLSGGQNPVVNVLALSVTWRDWFGGAAPGQVYAEIYRTVSTAPTPTFFLVDRIVVSNTNVASLTPNAYVSYTDTTTDGAITTSSILYTAGGVLDNPCPPGLTTQCVHKGRLWAVDETLRTIWFTQQFSAGLAPTWNELMTFPVPDGGDITALAELDDKLIVFKASSVWVVYGGDGPTQVGTGSDVTAPQRIASDVGALDWQSVVLMPEGLMFQAASGIYLLDRSLAVTWIGKNVTDSLAQFPTVVGATLVPSATQVRFNCTDGVHSAAIVYDYELKWWTVHTYSQVSAPVAASSLSQNGTYSLLTTDGQLWQESSSTWLDSDSSGTGHFVPTVISTAWVKIQGVQGYQRCRRVLLNFAQQESCGLSIGLAVNYEAPIVQAATFPSAAVDALPPGIPVDMHLAGAYNKQMAIQITVSDLLGGASRPTGQGARFSGLAVELDAIGDRYRQVSAQGRA